MKKIDRWETIIRNCRSQGEVRVTDLVRELNSSEATIRRDLREMEDLNMVVRFFGGAKLQNDQSMEPPMLLKAETNSSSKKRIGYTAAKLIRDNMMIYIDAGSTTYEMIDYITAKNITVVTNGIPHISKLGQKGINTIVLGGRLRWSTEALVGSQTIRQLKDLYFDMSFLGVNGIHEYVGLTTSNEMEASIKSTVIEKSTRSYALGDKSKFNLLFPVKFAEFADITIISDEIPDFDRSRIRYLLITGETNEKK